MFIVDNLGKHQKVPEEQEIQQFHHLVVTTTNILCDTIIL